MEMRFKQFNLLTRPVLEGAAPFQELAVTEAEKVEGSEEEPALSVTK